MTGDASAVNWASKSLYDLVSIRNGLVDPTDPLYADLPLIAPDHIASGTGQLTHVETAAEQGAISGKYLVEPGDIIYSKIRPYLQKAHLSTFRALCSADMYALAPKPGVDARFVLHLLLGEQFTNFVATVSARSGIPKVNRVELSQYEQAVPPSSEQSKIGQVLEDVDALVESLGRAIRKKQNIRKGLAQQLLTGRTRLPGFTTDWQVVRLSDLASTFGGLTGKTKKDFGRGSARYVTFMDVITNTSLDGPDLEAVAVSEGERQHRVKHGDLLLNGSSETPEEVALAAVVDFDPGRDTYLNSFCFGLRLLPNVDADPMFLAHYLRGPSGRSHVAPLAQGATRYNISKTKLLGLEMPLPSLDEQRALAGVMGDADAEIAALERRSEKTLQIRQGMMQELLTGRTRLPAGDPQEVAA